MIEKRVSIDIYFLHMDDTQKMLKIIINGQSTFRQEVLSKLDKVDKKVDKLGERLENKIDGIDKNLTGRLDKIGKQLAYLEDDTPTREEYDVQEKRVDKIEQTIAPAL
jgi:tetrahydromethanopterin S-methyltransferase subunit G